MVPTSYQFLLPPKNSHTYFSIPPNESQSHFFFILVLKERTIGEKQKVKGATWMKCYSQK